MTTATVSFDVSQDVLASLRIGPVDLGNHIRLLAAIAYFQEKKLSLGKAAELAGLNRLAFMDVLAQQGITLFDYDESMLPGEIIGIAHLETPADDHQ
ncbi:UPF0175 family protein [candidate division KSB3 bacterium]|uniref:UPF0175 family protein n=1 Tax=candidate division KSB3 bacterium TaxID=2044937 RepID=A0A9D5Q6A2_9BACT|nr:UPF0175 family protein [candidate division KSB3 bacterium]MBD3325198.1 UPF0175 family protein [candidate division KSB3 bacterium]